MAANIRFLTNNRVIQATPAITASSAVATLPAANVAQSQRTKVWRATGCASEYLDFDFGATGEACAALAVVNHNLTTGATITLKAGATQGASDALNESFEAWQPLYLWGDFIWGEDGFTWGGYPTDKELWSNTLRAVYFDPTAARWWRVGFEDSANAAGYVEAGLIYLGKYFEPQRNFVWDYSFTPQDESRTSQSLGGQTWTDIQSRRYLLDLAFKQIRLTDVWASFVEMARRMGLRNDFIIDLFPDEPTGFRPHYTRLYCRLASVPQIASKFNYRADINMSLRESL